MKRIIVVFVAVIALSSLTYAQDYNQAIGIRGGLYNGITYKTFLGSKSAFEGIISSRWRGIGATALYEIHSHSAFDVSHLSIYYGIGGHVGIYDGDYTTWGTTGVFNLAIGIDGILGLEYSFEDIPINLSIDWKPAFNIIGGGFWADGGALSIRYLFDR